MIRAYDKYVIGHSVSISGMHWLISSSVYGQVILPLEM